MQAYGWPGNIRELQNALERAVVFAAGDVIDVDSLPREIEPTLQLDTVGVVSSADSTDETPWPTLTDVEREHVRVTLARTGHNQSTTANMLGINRATLARKISEYQLSPSEVRRGRPPKAAELRS